MGRAQQKAIALKQSTVLKAQQILTRHKNKSALHVYFLAWREPTWRSRKAAYKYVNRVLYLVSQRYWKASIMRCLFLKWRESTQKIKTLLPIVCPVCGLTEPPGLELRRWQ